MPIIDIHTHMMSEKGAPHYSIKHIKGGHQAIHEQGAPFLTLTAGMLDYRLRLKSMDQAGVDLAIVSLTCPSVYWGSAEDSTRAAQVINDDMRAAQCAYPDRIRFLATLPWQYPQLAVRELERACAAGTVGVMVLANIRGRHLTDPQFSRSGMQSMLAVCRCSSIRPIHPVMERWT
jgi:aminocarboxymuconate-semialdehyde decarboxylase